MVSWQIPAQRVPQGSGKRWVFRAVYSFDWFLSCFSGKCWVISNLWSWAATLTLPRELWEAKLTQICLIHLIVANAE